MRYSDTVEPNNVEDHRRDTPRYDTGYTFDGKSVGYSSRGNRFSSGHGTFGEDILKSLSGPTMSIDRFVDYLEAKRNADERARDCTTFELFLRLLTSFRRPSVLDVGTGTGAMARRVSDALAREDVEITGIDTRAESIEIARSRAAEGGYERLRFECRSVFDSGKIRYAAITAHSFVDEFPPRRLLRAFADHLVPGGLVYASLTYNGRTELWPRAGDRNYERKLLAEYDRSMDERLFDGIPVAGSHGASSFLAEAERCGFEIVHFGGADWCIQPENGAYPEGDATVLDGMIDFIANEANRRSKFDPQRTEAWRSTRRKQIAVSTLRLLVHHLDAVIRITPEARRVLSG